MTSFRQRLIEAHLEGERGKALRAITGLRAIHRCQVYHKTAGNLVQLNQESDEFITLIQLTKWMKVAPNVGPGNFANYHSFMLEYRDSFNLLENGNLIHWGQLDGTIWKRPDENSARGHRTGFRMSEHGIAFMKTLPSDDGILGYLNLKVPAGA